MTMYKLYVDESGNFKRLVDDIVVAGVLVSFTTSDQELDERLRALVQEKAPGRRWPPHASQIRPITFALLDDPNVDPIVRKARDVLAREEPRLFADTLRTIEHKREVPYEAANTLDKVLRRVDYSTYTRLAQRDQLFRVLMRGLPAEIERATGGARVVAFVATESARGAIGRLDTHRDDPYLSLLEALRQRCCRYLAQLGHGTEAEHEALTRGVRDPGTGVMRDLSAGDLGRVECTSSSGHRAVLRSGNVRSFDTNASVFLVLADYSSNGAWRTIAGSQHTALSRLESFLRMELNCALPSARGESHIVAIPCPPDAMPHRWAIELCR